MDREVGRVLALLQESGLEEKTIVIFTSDNGPLYDELGGTDAEFFNSAGGFRGRKGSYYEGGFREPRLVRWPGKIQPGTVSGRVTATTELYDLAHDPHETADLAAQHPAVVAKLGAIAKAQHVKSPLWPIRALDGESDQ